MKNKFFLLFILTISFLSLGCSDVQLAPPKLFTQASNSISYCTSPSDAIQTEVKFIFVVDRSGSNQQRFDVNNNFAPLPGTDPDGSRRFDAMLRFIEGYEADPLVYWSMINLASDANVSQNFTNKKEGFYNFVADQKDRTVSIDGGGTNYLSALEQIGNIIENDMADSAKEDPVIASNYIVFFISDGAPFVGDSLQDFQDILDRLQSIKTVEKDKRLVDSFQFNTAYYFEDPVDPQARQLLTDMSIEGDGDFLEFGAGQEIDLSQFSVPSKIAKFFLREIWVYNLNTIWFENDLHRDADGDMLADELERRIGSNPNAYDSDGNGVGDGVEYRLSGESYACLDSNCSPDNADPFISCSSLRESNDPVSFGDQDEDGLNDCEEKVLGLNINDPDTNKDYLSDRYAVMTEVLAMEGTNDLNLDRDFDGITNYNELKQNSPTQTHNDSLQDYRPLSLKIELTNRSSENDCYNIDISDLAFRHKEDNVRIEVFENTSSVHNKRIFRKGIKKIDPFGAVQFNNSDLN